MKRKKLLGQPNAIILDLYLFPDEFEEFEKVFKWNKIW